MNINRHLGIILGLFLCFFISCSKSKKPTEVVDTKNVIGKWKEEIVIPDFTFTADLNIAEIDSLFELIIKDASKTTYQHFGKWKIEGNYITLMGDSANIYDTVTQSLVLLPDSLSKINLNLDTAGTSTDIWNIPVPQLGTIPDNLPIDPNIVLIIKLLTLEFERQTKFLH